MSQEVRRVVSSYDEVNVSCHLAVAIRHLLKKKPSIPLKVRVSESLRTDVEHSGVRNSWQLFPCWLQDVPLASKLTDDNMKVSNKPRALLQLCTEPERTQCAPVSQQLVPASGKVSGMVDDCGSVTRLDS